MPKRRVVWLVLFLLVPVPRHVLAWGDEGHRIIALLAETRLQKAALDRTIELVGPGGLASVATWADDVRAGHGSITITSTTIKGEQTAPWHFVNIPVSEGPVQNRYDRERDCPRDDCVVEQIERFKKVLADPNGRKTDRVHALKFLVHLIGDVHQPLHCAKKGQGRGDRGGNTVEVTFFGSVVNPHAHHEDPWTLHGIWDTGLLEHRGVTEASSVKHLQRWLRFQKISRLQRGTSADWANESHEAAVRYAYDIPQDRRLGDDYYRRNVAVVNERLATAGVRLARTLNELLKKP